MLLTDLAVRSLTSPNCVQKTFYDDTTPGFGVRVSNKGTKSFVVTIGRARRRITLGRYPVVGLADARRKARELLAKHALGEETPRSFKFEEAVEIFLATHFPPNYPKPRTKAAIERLLKKHFFPSLRYEEIANIRKDAIARVVDRLHKTPSEARHAFGAMRQFCNWAEGREYISRNPCAGLKPVGKQQARDRVLSEAELKAVLLQARSSQSSFHSIVELLAYTGQRRNEMASLRVEWIDWDKRTITIPGEIAKNRRKHTFPFGDHVAEVLARGNKKGLLFPARDKPDTVVNGWSKLKPDFDQVCPVREWVLHDLRRTFATNLASLGVPIQVTEKLLNHVSGTTSGIVGVYQRYAYAEEMRQAIDRWENYLKQLLGYQQGVFANENELSDRVATPTLGRSHLAIAPTG